MEIHKNKNKIKGERERKLGFNMVIKKGEAERKLSSNTIIKTIEQ